MYHLTILFDKTRDLENIPILFLVQIIVILIHFLFTKSKVLNLRASPEPINRNRPKGRGIEPISR